MSDRALHHDIARTERLPVSTLFAKHPNRTIWVQTFTTALCHWLATFRDPSRKGFVLRAGDSSRGGIEGPPVPSRVLELVEVVTSGTDRASDWALCGFSGGLWFPGHEAQWE